MKEMRAPTLTKIPLDNQKTINIPLDFISAEVLSNQLNQIRNWISNSKTKQSQKEKEKEKAQHNPRNSCTPCKRQGNIYL